MEGSWCVAIVYFPLLSDNECIAAELAATGPVPPDFAAPTSPPLGPSPEHIEPSPTTQAAPDAATPAAATSNTTKPQPEQASQKTRPKNPPFRCNELTVS